MPLPGESAPGAGLPENPDADWDADADADLARLIAEADAGLIQIPAEDAVPGVWFSVAGVADPAEIDLAGLAQGGPLNTMPPDAVLAAMAAEGCDPAVLASLSDDQVLGLAAAGRRLASRGAWVQQAAVAEFAARRLEPDRKKASPLGFTPFAADELVPELVVTTTTAELAMSQARDVVRRLPACRALLRDGRIGEYQLKIITESVQCLSDAGAAEADILLAAAAPGMTSGMLRAMCAKTVLLIDPQAAQKRKETAAKGARIERFQEYSGNAALSGRELPPDEVLAASAHIDACARQLRAAGMEGTLQQLRVRAFLDLTQGLDPLARLTAQPMETENHDESGDSGSDDDQSSAHNPDSDSGHRAGGEQATSTTGAGDGHDDDGESAWDEPDFEDTDHDGPCSAGPGASPFSRPPVKAVINLLVPAGALFGWSTAPGEIPGFGLLDPQTTRDLTEAASAHPETRWCVTVIGPDGTAAAHGCAPGSHPWTPGHANPGDISDPGGGRNPDGLGPPAHQAASGDRGGPAPPPDPAEQAAQVRDLLRRLRVRLSPIAKGTCDHRHYSDRYVISRTVKHLLHARAVKCTAPGCNRPAAESDADHTVPWPDGPSCECNLGAPCRYHHRNKQAPGWRLDQPEPGVMKWRNPSGRTHTTYPTKYLI